MHLGREWIYGGQPADTLKEAIRVAENGKIQHVCQRPFHPRTVGEWGF